MTQPQQPPDPCTVKQLATYLLSLEQYQTITERTIQYWVTKNRFPNAIRLNPDASRSPILIPWRDIVKFLEVEKEKEKEPPE